MARYMFDKDNGWCDFCGEEMTFGSFDDCNTRDLCHDCQKEFDDEEN